MCVWSAKLLIWYLTSHGSSWVCGDDILLASEAFPEIKCHCVPITGSSCDNLDVLVALLVVTTAEN